MQRTRSRLLEALSTAGNIAESSEFRGARFGEEKTDQQALRITTRKPACDGYNSPSKRGAAPPICCIKPPLPLLRHGLESAARLQRPPTAPHQLSQLCGRHVQQAGAGADAVERVLPVDVLEAQATLADMSWSTQQTGAQTVRNRQ